MSAKSTRYIMTKGELRREDNSITFRNSQGIYRIPIKGTKSLYLLEEVSLNTRLLDFLARAGVTVHFFNYSGRYSGSFVPHQAVLDGRLRCQQMTAAISNRVSLAKEFVRATGQNMRETLSHYVRHGKQQVRSLIAEIEQLISYESLIRVHTIRQLLRLEGEMWKHFYAAIDLVTHPNFPLERRTRRPPHNPLNALISFCNMLLYTKVIDQIQRTGLDPTVSFLHEPGERRFSLALDVAEVFKPTVVFRTVLELINNRRVDADRHFERRDGGCFLNEDGRKIVVTAMEERFQRTVSHSKLRRPVRWESLILFDLYKLMKCFRGMTAGEVPAFYDDRRKE